MQFANRRLRGPVIGGENDLLPALRGRRRALCRQPPPDGQLVSKKFMDS
jgi:hypothetical protein